MYSAKFGVLTAVLLRTVLLKCSAMPIGTGSRRFDES